jgi:N6-adenosine-specific RNA methylase IME4
MRNTREDSQLEDAFWKLQEELGPDHVRLEPLLLEIALRERRSGRIIRAQAIVRRVVAMRRARLSSEPPTVVACADD